MWFAVPTPDVTPCSLARDTDVPAASIFRVNFEEIVAPVLEVFRRGTGSKLIQNVGTDVPNNMVFCIRFF
jgi:hypothetical protein